VIGSERRSEKCDSDGRNGCVSGDSHLVIWNEVPNTKVGIVDLWAQDESGI
jgi:hypothetical protein